MTVTLDAEARAVARYAGVSRSTFDTLEVSTTDTVIVFPATRPGLSTLKQRLDNGEISKEQARAELDAIPGLAEDIAEAEKQIDRMEAGGL